MKGYFKDLKATAKKIKEGWYYTGDLGRLDEDGYLYVLGRTDDMVITEVSMFILQRWRPFGQPSKVQEAAVVGIPDSRRGRS